MSFINTPVKIPDVKGKITLRQYNDRTYVRYEIGRTYNRDRKSTNPKRVNIGLQIRTAPTLMLPNENYEVYFSKNGVEKMTEKKRTAAENYEMTCNDFWMLNCLFEQMYLEFQIQAHRNPHFVVNAFKIQRINKVLVPLKRMMEDKPYGAFLEIPEEPREVVEEEMLETTVLNPEDGSPEELPVPGLCGGVVKSKWAQKNRPHRTKSKWIQKKRFRRRPKKRVVNFGVFCYTSPIEKTVYTVFYRYLF